MAGRLLPVASETGSLDRAMIGLLDRRQLVVMAFDALFGAYRLLGQLGQNGHRFFGGYRLLGWRRSRQAGDKKDTDQGDGKENRPVLTHRNLLFYLLYYTTHAQSLVRGASFQDAPKPLFCKSRSRAAALQNTSKR
jgi:hypothetical protein